MSDQLGSTAPERRKAQVRRTRKQNGQGTEHPAKRGKRQRWSRTADLVELAHRLRSARTNRTTGSEATGQRAPLEAVPTRPMAACGGGVPQESPAAA